MTQPASHVGAKGLVSIVIVSWNVLEYLHNCLQSVLAAGESISSEIIVVDNASTDGTIDVIRRAFPGVRLIQNDLNLGFPVATNIGIRASRGEYVLLLNPDTLVPPSILEQCLKAIDTRPDVGILGCRIQYPDGRVQLECARRLPSLVTLFLETFYLHMLFPRHPIFGRHLLGDWDHGESRYVPCISGAFMLARRRALDDVGLLAESFFMYHEDVDLCAKMRENLWAVYYLSEATIVHFGGRSRANSDFDFDAATPELWYTYFREHHGALPSILCRALFLMRGMVRFCIALAGAPVLLILPSLRKRGVFRPALHIRTIAWALIPGLRRVITHPIPERDGAR